MWGNSTVNEMWGNSTVKERRGRGTKNKKEQEQQELDPKKVTIQGMRGIISVEALSEQEQKRLCQKLKKAERQIQLYSTIPRNRAERRARKKREA